MSTLNTKVTKVIDIPTVGDNSITGSIYQEHGESVMENAREYLWVILCPPDGFYKAKEDAEALGITFILADRLTSKTNI